MGLIKANKMGRFETGPGEHKNPESRPGPRKESLSAPVRPARHLVQVRALMVREGKLWLCQVWGQFHEPGGDPAWALMRQYEIPMQDEEIRAIELTQLILAHLAWPKGKHSLP